MIQGIDIFQPTASGLPDLSKISVSSIFNGSAAASLESMKSKYPDFWGDTDKDEDGTAVKPAPKKPTAVEQILGGSMARENKAASKPRRGYIGGGYTVVPDMPVPEQGGGIPDQPLGGGDVTSELPDGENSGPGNLLLPPVTPEQTKSGPNAVDVSDPVAGVDLPALWGKVSTGIMDELRSLKLIK